MFTLCKFYPYTCISIYLRGGGVGGGGGGGSKIEIKHD